MKTFRLLPPPPAILLAILMFGTLVFGDDPCAGVPAYVPGQVYATSGIKVKHNNNLYISKWWTSATPPGEGWDLQGPCGEGGGGGGGGGGSGPDVSKLTPVNSQQFAPLGCDLNTPFIDPYLLVHSVYADNLYGAYTDCYSPNAGVVGTAGTFRTHNNRYNQTESSNGCYVLQSKDGGYFRTVNKNISPNGSGVKVSYYDGLSTPSIYMCGSNGSVEKLTRAPYSYIDPSNAYNASYNGTIRPKFPDFSSISGKFTATNDFDAASNRPITPGTYRNLTVRNGVTVDMEAGTYYFNGSVKVGENAKLMIRPKNGDYQTVIYVKEQFVLSSNGGTFAPYETNGGFSACSPEKEALGKILVMAFGTESTNYEEWDVALAKAAVAFGSNSTVGVGTFIAPRGGIYVMCGAIVHGQLLAKDVDFAYGYNNPSNPAGCTRACNTANVFNYVSFSVNVGVTVSKTEFLEDKNWNNAPNNNAPTYTGGYSWSSDKNKDRVDTIWVELNEPLAIDELKLDYTISDNTARVGTLPSLSSSSTRPSNWIGERAFVSRKTETLIFKKGDLKKPIPILIIDDGEYQSAENSVFNLKISGTVASQNCSEESNISNDIKITILSDDPNKPAKPEFNSNRLFEYYKDQSYPNGYQEAGNFSAPAPVGNYTFKIVDARDLGGNDVRSWLTVVGSQIRTTDQYKADYEESAQREIKIKAVAEVFGNTSDEAEFTLQISPWNDNPFDPQDDMAETDEDKKPIFIDVLANDKADEDKPEDKNVQKIAGLTLNEKFPVAQRNASPDRTQKITTAMGATVSVENGKIKYDIGTAPTITPFDVFYYTALDSAEYGYNTDIWVKSVKVTVANIPVPILKDAYYYDSKGSGVVDRVVISFDKDIDPQTMGIEIVFDGVQCEIDGFEWKDEDDKKTIVVFIKGAPKNKTSGNMTGKVVQEIPNGDDVVYVPQSLLADDKAAPVVVWAKCVSPADGSKDTLYVEFSEDVEQVVGGKNIPFLFIIGGGSNPSDKIKFDDFPITKIDSRTYKLVVSEESKGRISGGDSIFINYNAVAIIKDVHGNEQTIYGNKRVPIEQEIIAKIVSAAFFDRKTKHDGYVNVVRVELGTDITRPLAEEIVEKLNLPLIRQFEKVGGIIEQKDNWFEFGVLENAAKEAEKGNRDKYYPRTSTNDDDAVWLSDTIKQGEITIVSGGSGVPVDSVAPVILYATYKVGKDTTLEVVFSEAVDLQGGKGNPYSFLHKSLSDDKVEGFEMKFKSSPSKVKGDSVWKYDVDWVSIPYPAEGDSVWIIEGGYVFDKSKNNEQKLTTTAPLRFSGEYPTNMELKIVPQPMRLSKNGKGHEPQELENGIADYYGFPRGKKGVAIILEVTGCATNFEKQKGGVKIIDQTGNLVNVLPPMEFKMTSDGKFVAGVTFWDGKNRQGRTVGAAAYWAIVDAEIFYDCYNPARKQRVTYRKPIGAAFSSK